MLIMSRYTEEEEEAEYYYEHHPGAVRPRAQKQHAKPIGPVQQPHYGVNPNQYASPAGPAQVNPNQYASPAGPARPTAMERIKRGAGSSARVIADTAAGVSDGVRQFDNNPMGKSLHQWADRHNAPQGRAGNNQEPPVHPSSVMHPGHKLYVIEGSIIMSGGGQKAPEERQRRRGRGGLGGANPGFGNDNGL